MASNPDKIVSLYGGRVKIAFFEKQHRYSHVLPDGSIDRRWITSVTGATGMLDKSGALVPWAVRLSKEYLIANLFDDTQSFKIQVTEKTLFYLIDESHKQHQIKKEEGASVGDRVHKWAEQYAMGLNPPMPVDEQVLNGVSGFLQLVTENKVEFLDAERIVYSKKYDYVGLLDARAKMLYGGKKKVVKYVDYKTNNWQTDRETGKRKSVVYPEMRYQVAGYRGAHTEEFGENNDGRLIFHFDKQTGDVALHDLDEKPDAYEKDFNCFLGLLNLKKRDKELARL